MKEEIQPVTYPSAVDTWLVAVVILAILGPLAFALLVNDIITLFVSGGIFLLLLLFGYPARYILTEDALIIRMGFLYRKRIAFDQIENLSLSDNPLSGPAWSLKRVEVKLRSGLWGFVLISPKERSMFMDELNRRKESTG